MDILQSVLLVGSVGMAMFLAGISLAGLSGKTLPLSYYLSQPLNRDIVNRTKVFLRRYGIPFTLFFIGGVTFVVAAAIMLVAIFQRALLG